MTFRINHIHLKSPDPKALADWFVEAFNLKIDSDTVRVFGDRFIACYSEDRAMQVNVSGARTGEQMGVGDADTHYGLEHFGFDVQDMDAELKRLQALGAVLAEGPTATDDGRKIAFIKVPDNIRIELIQQKA